MPTHTTTTTLFLALSFITGLAASGCKVTRPNPAHCLHARGDQSCADQFPDRPFCSLCSEDPLGCVAELPEELSCASPCGGGASAEEDMSCVELAGDGDGDSDTDAEADTAGDGDSTPSDQPNTCGDGSIGGEEACDDGNSVDHDECTNACELPACGDGIVTPSANEECDAGESNSDACTASCTLPGSEIWSQRLDVNPNQHDPGRQVALDIHNNIAVLSAAETAPTLLELDPEGEQLWSQSLNEPAMRALAIGPEDELTLAGQLNDFQGSLRQFDDTGVYQWFEYPGLSANLHHVSIGDSGYTLTAGTDDLGALLILLDPSGTPSWTLNPPSERAGPVLHAGETLWTILEDPYTLQRRDVLGMVQASTALQENYYEAMIADAEGGVYLLSGAITQQSWTLTRFDSEGDEQWSRIHDEQGIEWASGLALLPGGGALVAGGVLRTAGEADGVLSWIDAEGDPLRADLILDGTASTDFDRLYDVDVSADLDHGVAVGGQQELGEEETLWIYKFEL